MSKYVTIRFKQGVNCRPFQEGDVNGELSKEQGGGMLLVHNSYAEARAHMDAFWIGKGYQKEIGI